MSDKIAEFKEAIAVLKSLPEDIYHEVENSPEKIDAYYLLMDELKKTAVKCLSSFFKIQTALDIKHNSGGATYQNLKEKLDFEMDKAEFDQVTNSLQDKPLSEILDMF